MLLDDLIAYLSTKQHYYDRYPFKYALKAL